MKKQIPNRQAVGGGNSAALASVLRCRSTPPPPSQGQVQQVGTETARRNVTCSSLRGRGRQTSRRADEWWAVARSCCARAGLLQGLICRCSSKLTPEPGQPRRRRQSGRGSRGCRQQTEESGRGAGVEVQALRASRAAVCIHRLCFISTASCECQCRGATMGAPWWAGQSMSFPQILAQRAPDSACTDEYRVCTQHGVVHTVVALPSSRQAASCCPPPGAHMSNKHPPTRCTSPVPVVRGDDGAAVC